MRILLSEEKGKTHGRGLTKQSFLSQNNSIKLKNRLKPEEKFS